MNKEQLAKTKIELAKKVLPHLLDPGREPACLSLSECATLMSTDRLSLTAAQAGNLEREALAQLGAALRSKGVASAADCMPARRG